jgi:hypothetical protein
MIKKVEIVDQEILIKPCKIIHQIEVKIDSKIDQTIGLEIIVEINLNKDNKGNEKPITK